jgi:hypothetical protein
MFSKLAESGILVSIVLGLGMLIVFGAHGLANVMKLTGGPRVAIIAIGLALAGLLAFFSGVWSGDLAN